MKHLTPEEIEELERLKKSEYVKLARKEERLKWKEKQQLYTLRAMEKRGRKLAEDGITLDDLDNKLSAIQFDKITNMAYTEGEIEE